MEKVMQAVFRILADAEKDESDYRAILDALFSVLSDMGYEESDVLMMLGEQGVTLSDFAGTNQYDWAKRESERTAWQQDTSESGMQETLKDAFGQAALKKEKIAKKYGVSVNAVVWMGGSRFVVVKDGEEIEVAYREGEKD